MELETIEKTISVIKAVSSSGEYDVESMPEKEYLVILNYVTQTHTYKESDQYDYLTANIARTAIKNNHLEIFAKFALNKEWRWCSYIFKCAYTECFEILAHVANFNDEFMDDVVCYGTIEALNYCLRNGGKMPTKDICPDNEELYIYLYLLGYDLYRDNYVVEIQTNYLLGHNETAPGD